MTNLVFFYSIKAEIKEAGIEGSSNFFCRTFRLRLHGAIYRRDSFVLMLSYCANLKAIRYDSTSLDRIVAEKSHRIIVFSVGLLEKTEKLYDIYCAQLKTLNVDVK